MRMRALGALVAILSLTGVAGPPAEAAPKAGGTMKIALLRDPTGWDPHINYGATTYTFQANVYEGTRPVLPQGHARAWTRRALGDAEPDDLRAAPPEGCPFPQRQPVHRGRREVEPRADHGARDQRDAGQGVRGRRGGDGRRSLHGPDRAQAARRTLHRAARSCRGGHRRQQVGGGRRGPQEGGQRDGAVQARPLRDRGPLQPREESRLLGVPLSVPRPDRARHGGQGRRPGPGTHDGDRRPRGVHPLAGSQGAGEGPADQGPRGLRHLQRDPHEPQAPALRQREGSPGAELPRRPEGDRRLWRGAASADRSVPA